MSKKNNLYLGKAGQSLIMSEFLARGWNVAIPEVDVGDDLFVVEDQKGVFHRVQVKTSQATERTDSYSAMFSVPFAQLNKEIIPEIYYVFVIRKMQKWANVLLIDRSILLDLHEKKQMGSLHSGNITLYMVFKEDKVTCSSVDLSAFIDNYRDFPVIPH
jgi:hypothetical protein